MKKRINNKTISNLITLDDIGSWGSDEIVTISAQTGTGKSYFIKNVLYDIANRYNEKILFLLHRTNCVDQFKAEIERDRKTDVIDIRTYQIIESRDFYFGPYKYIVCDEFHYFLGDALFSCSTDISLNQILDLQNKVKIFMSGTGEDAKRYINDEKKIKTTDYSLPKDYSYIKELTYFYSDDDVEEIIDDFVKRGEKGIVFIQSAVKAFNLYNKYKCISLFNCGKSDKHYKHVDQAKIRNMLRDEKFKEQILFTTSCLDAGVNIKDPKLVNVICDIQDTGSMIQCIGRKRVEYTDDYLNVNIKAITNQQLGGRLMKNESQTSMADYLRKHTVKGYVDKYGRQPDQSGIVYDIEVSDPDKASKEINEVKYFKYKYDRLAMKDMLDPKKNYYGYVTYVAKLLHRNFRFTFWDNGKRQLSLDQYLDSVIGEQMLQVKDRKELIDRIDVKSNGKKLKSIDSLNDALKEREIPFIIVEFSTSKIINGKQKRYPSAWEILKLSS